MVDLIVKAKKVKEGDYLPALDNGYVYEDPERDPYVLLGDRRYPYAVPEGFVMISFHDSDGEENYVVVGKNVPVSVRRETVAGEGDS